MDNSLLIAAATAYYNGHNLIMQDDEYDKLLKAAKDNDPNFNIFNEIVIGEDRTNVEHYFSYTPQAYKKQFYDMDEFIDFYKKSNLIFTYKLDGCSITAYYKNGELFDILTRSDETSGKRKFDQLKNKVPQKVDPSVIKIDFEAVCSTEDYGDDVRSNANGLVNSCYKQDEVDQYLKLIPFKVTCDPLVCTDYLKSFEYAGLKCEIIIKDPTQMGFDERHVFYHGKHYPIDGFVGYKNTVDSHEIWKHYANQEIVTKVTNIEWNYKDTLAWTPKVIFNPIRIDGRNCRQATSNGLNNLRKLKCGIGAEITIFLANSTIPMVGSVIKESENYNIMKTCPYCGAPLEEVQYKLRCTNPYCDNIVSWVGEWLFSYLNNNYSTNFDKDNINNIDDLKLRLAKYAPSVTEEMFFTSLGWSLVVERFNNYDLFSKILVDNKDSIIKGTSCIDFMVEALTDKQAEICYRFKNIFDDLVACYLSNCSKNGGCNEVQGV